MLQVLGQTAQDVRTSVVAEMASKWARYSAFIDESQRDDYLGKMASASEYAGEPELAALSAVWGVTIQVWGAETTHTISASGDLTRPTINLVHRNNGDPGGLLDHYWFAEFPE